MRKPLVRKQLIALGSASVVCTVVLMMCFMRLPETLKLNRYDVRAEFTASGGLYEGAQVNYLGHPVGRVTGMELSEHGFEATLRLKDEVDVPATVVVEVHSMSAVGEQYVELVPAREVDDSTPLLSEGDRIGVGRTSAPVEIGPVLDNLQALVDSVPPEQLSVLINETGAALDGRSSDLEEILGRGASLIETADANFRPTAILIEDTEPLLTTVNGQSAEIDGLTRNLRDVTDELRAGDADLRLLLEQGPSFATETTELIDDLEPVLPTFLKPVTTVSTVLARYHNHLEQLLSDYPLAVAAVQSVTLPEAATDDVRLTLANLDDPPECLEGFLPVEQWASPYDPSPRDPQLLYCTLAADDPRAVRGARNLPCPNDPARREGDSAECR